MNHPIYSEEHTGTNLNEVLTDHYDLGDASNTNRVYHFLETQPSLSTFLIHAPSKIREFFPNEGLKLDHIDDPELPTLEQLFIRIHSQDIDQALEQLQDLDETWWLDIPQEISAKLCITLGM